MEVFEDISSPEPEEHKLVELKKFSHREIIIKRGIDILGGLVGSGLFLIAAALLYVPYKMSSKKDQGPMFYKQKRYGKNGKIFYILKFRTMIVNAEQYLELHPEVKAAYHANGKKKKTIPVTKIGSFIKKPQIDEFPQFINVLKGIWHWLAQDQFCFLKRKNMGSASLTYSCVNLELLVIGQHMVEVKFVFLNEQI